MLVLTVLFSLVGCAVDEGSDAVFADDEYPKIFFVVWETAVTVEAGEELDYAPVVSPNDGATYKWTFGAETIAETKDLQYTPDTPGTYELIFEVTRNGLVSSRTAQVTVN